MRDYLKRAWANIDLDALRHNYREIKNVSGAPQVMAIIKADAYGHGAVKCAAALESEGAAWFGVSNIEEAVELREGGISGSVLVLGYTPPELAGKLIEYGISQTVFSSDYAARLSEEAAKCGSRVRVHIKVDTGMSRLGFLCRNDGELPSCADDISAAAALGGLYCEGIFMHFPCADSLNADDIAFTKEQYRIFTALISRLEEGGVSFDVRHCCNSAAAMMYPGMHLDMVRAGVVLYGLSPSDEIRGKMDLRPVMELKSVISSIKDVSAETYVSYGRTEQLCKDGTLAVVPIGYADGYRRCLSSKGFMLVGGRRARIVGRVCMDQTIIDVTGFDGLHCGQEVTCIGTDGSECISADELAEIEGTINYEIVCLISKRVTKIYRENGRPVDSTGLLHR